MIPYQIVDAHCDTVSEIYQPTSLKQSAGHLDLPRIREYKNWLQFFAVWAEAGKGIEAQQQRTEEIIAHFYAEMEENQDAILQVKSFSDIAAAWSRNKAAALMTIEGADFIDTLEKLHAYYNKGVRCITLTWNNSNCIATGAGERRPKAGLTVYGKEFVQEMNTLGMLVDVSHASEKTFWDVVETSGKPITASHSNAAAVCGHKRNLTDEQFRAICSMGGVVGINYYPLFVNNTNCAGLDDVICHIEHFMSLGGEDHIGLGGDFDGIDTTPAGLDGVEDVYKLLDALLTRNYSEQQVKKIAGGNFLRLLGEILK